MENTPHKISVRIGGMYYNLVSSESESYTRQVAARADEMIRRVASSNPQLSQHMATVLALTNAVDESMRLSRQQTLAEQQRDTAEMKTTELRTELARERELNWELKKELLHIRTLLKNQADAKPIEKKRAQATINPPVAEDTIEAGEKPVETISIASSAPPDEPLQPEQASAIPEMIMPEPDPSRTFGELRQTGLDEYLALYSQSNSYIVVTPFDDEP